MRRRSSSESKASSQNMSCDDPAGSTISRVRKLISCCFGSSSSRSQQDVWTDQKEGISTGRGSRDLMIRKSCQEKSMSRSVWKRDPTSCLVDENSVYGREEDKKAILALLMNCDASNRDGGVRVVAIKGEGGVGKTTVAQVVYHDATVENSFDLRLWVFVPEDFDVVRTTKIIIREITKETCKLSDDLNNLQLMLKEELREKRVLIILDDVWKVESEQWDLLLLPFAAAQGGVKVLVTTRNIDLGVNIPSIMGTIADVSPYYNLEVLSDADCLSVLAHHALGKKKFDAHPNLEAIGKKIARQCKGSPLIAKIFGGNLRSRLNYDEWENMLNCEIWDSHQEIRDGVFPPLCWHNKIVFDGSRRICTICCCTLSLEEC